MAILNFLLGYPDKSTKNAAAVLASALLLLTLVSFLIVNREMVAAGGHHWVHGDWLISFAGGPVRRGLGGSAILEMSDLFGISPLILVEIAQGTALAMLVLTLIWALWRVGSSERLILCMISPAFVLAWHNDFGSHGKEIVACLPYLPMVAAALGALRPTSALAAALILFLVASALHETAILHAPALCVAAWALSRGRLAIIFSVVAILTALLIVGTIVQTGPIADAAPLCDAIVGRGVDESVCGTAFVWTELNTRKALTFTLQRLPEREWLGISATFVLGYLPLVVAVQHSRRRWLWHSLILLTFVSFLPLYVVAIDYGRWLIMQVSAFNLALLVATASGWEQGAKVPLARWIFGSLICLALVWRVSMGSGGIGSGVAEPAVKAVLGIL